MEYQILKAESKKGIVNLTRDWIRDGWEPIGGVCCLVVQEDVFLDDYNKCRSDRLHFYQSIIKRPNVDLNLFRESYSTS